jgi:hypothetical protein
MRRALCVGIDEYPEGPLEGCVSDATRMRDVLARHQNGDPNFDCRLVVAPAGSPHNTITRTILREKLQQLFEHETDG